MASLEMISTVSTVPEGIFNTNPNTHVQSPWIKILTERALLQTTGASTVAFTINAQEHPMQFEALEEPIVFHRWLREFHQLPVLVNDDNGQEHFVALSEHVPAPLIDYLVLRGLKIIIENHGSLSPSIRDTLRKRIEETESRKKIINDYDTFMDAMRLLDTNAVVQVKAGWPLMDNAGYPIASLSDLVPHWLNGYMEEARSHIDSLTAMCQEQLPSHHVHSAIAEHSEQMALSKPLIPPDQGTDESAMYIEAARDIVKRQLSGLSVGTQLCIFLLSSGSTPEVTRKEVHTILYNND